MMTEQHPHNDWEETAPEPTHPPMRGILPWDGGKALLFFVLAGLLSILTGIILQASVGFYFSVIAAELIAFLLLPYILSFLFRFDWDLWMAPPDMPASFWLWSALAVIAFAIAQSNLPVLFDRIHPMQEEHLQMFKDYLTAESYWEWLMVFFVAALVPAICEEITFRGVIQTGLRNTFGPRHAVVWGGLLFALLHLNPWSFVGLWCFGCLLGYLTEKSQSVRPAIFMHMLNNTFALAVIALQGKEQWEERPEFIPWYYTVAAGVVLVCALLRLHRIRRNSEMDKTGSGSVMAPHNDPPHSTR
jgi:membrane protease YdiL (CAAX protease family)